MDKKVLPEKQTRLRPTQKKPAQKEAFTMKKFIPGVQSRAAIAIIFAYALPSYDRVSAILKMLNRQGTVFVTNNVTLQQMCKEIPNEAKIMRNICTVKPLGLASFNEVEFVVPSRAQLRELLLYDYRNILGQEKK